MRVDDAPLEKLSRLFIEEREESEKMFADLQAGRATRVPEEKKLGKYILVRELGRGGVGKVWLAWEPELKRVVALKILGPQMRHEAQMLAQLDHPNIAKVYEVGEAHGMHYIAMQYIDGKSLDGITIDPAGAARVVRDAARIIQAAHDRGILHRDIKPGNLMMKNEEVFVIDFGLARPIDATVTGSIAGTVAFMSPEQAAGEKPLPDADIYSLGATLYRLATGHAPFEGSNLPEVLKKIAANDFPAPQVSKDLDAIILKAMAPPGKRYRSAGEMADDLDRFARSEPVEAVPPSRFVWMLKRHWPSLAVIALLALVGAFLVFRMFQARSEAVTFLEDADLFIRHGRFQEAEKQVDRALEMEGLTPRVMERRSRIMALKVAAERQRVETANLKLASARSILEQAKLNLYKKGSTFSQAFFSDLDKAMLELRESLALSESAEAHYLMGSILSLQGRYDEALKEFDSSNDSRSPLAKARTYIDMAIEALFEGREADSTLLLDSARQILAENGEASELAQAWKLLAQGDNEGAIEYSRERVRSDEEFQVVIGVAQARLKQPREAVRSFTAAIDRRPNYYQAFFYRGYAVKQAGNADYALREYDQAIAIYPHYVRALLARAEIYAERNERDKAVQDWKLVLKLRPEMKALEARINGR